MPRMLRRAFCIHLSPFQPSFHSLGNARLVCRSLAVYQTFLGGNAKDNMGLVVLQQRIAPRKRRAGVVGLIMPSIGRDKGIEVLRQLVLLAKNFLLISKQPELSVDLEAVLLR